MEHHVPLAASAASDEAGATATSIHAALRVLERPESASSSSNVFIAVNQICTHALERLSRFSHLTSYGIQGFKAKTIVPKQQHACSGEALPILTSYGIQGFKAKTIVPKQQLLANGRFSLFERLSQKPSKTKQLAVQAAEEAGRLRGMRCFVPVPLVELVQPAIKPHSCLNHYRGRSNSSTCVATTKLSDSGSIHKNASEQSRRRLEVQR